MWVGGCGVWTRASLHLVARKSSCFSGYFQMGRRDEGAPVTPAQHGFGEFTEYSLVLHQVDAAACDGQPAMKENIVIPTWQSSSGCPPIPTTNATVTGGLPRPSRSLDHWVLELLGVGERTLPACLLAHLAQGVGSPRSATRATFFYLLPSGGRENSRHGC